MSMAATSSVTVEVQCRVGSGNRVVGAVAVPVSDFLGDLTPEDYLHFLSYRLRDPRGVKNGIVNFSVRVIGGGGRGCSCSAAARKGAPPSSSWRMQVGVPVVGGRRNYGGGGVVTGIPVWGSSRGESEAGEKI
ncbi:unnamed protein product [Linum tenue]|uniref:Uncharacterized protein n=1 Tax=Linum tenue TaxID=586396 RepID=A0AAV0JTG6_9ROSI|nr:unnamed protein product [Linum tenue]CAI0412772.1 unnamed protein product [Linum tenue]